MSRSRHDEGRGRRKKEAEGGRPVAPVPGTSVAIAVVTASRTLSHAEARAVYDRIGRGQDTQAFYEDPALDTLVAHGDFGEASTILEMGCGTGRLAERLLRDHCPPKARYVGLDLSSRMVEIARDRIASFGDRAEVVLTDGHLGGDRPSASQDRVVATYLLDLLGDEEIRTFLTEAHRLLRDDGRLCVAGLTRGETVLGRAVSTFWTHLHVRRPHWVGGCRPLRIRPLVAPGPWTILHREIVRAWGVPSEVLVATPT